MWPNNAFSQFEEEKGLRICSCANKHRSRNHRLSKIKKAIWQYNKRKEAFKKSNSFTITETPKENVEKIVQGNKFEAALEETDVAEKVEIAMPVPKMEKKNI